eukprot:6489689-Amphidinium_carterae.2
MSEEWHARFLAILLVREPLLPPPESLELHRECLAMWSVATMRLAAAESRRAPPLASRVTVSGRLSWKASLTVPSLGACLSSEVLENAS